jgi:hypothetical protein
VAAVDKNGNESPYSEANSPATTGVDPATLVFALHGATPNPATGDNLRITFSLPSAEPATVLLVNIAGRTLASRALRSPTPGAQSLTLTGARGLPAGIYLVHLTQVVVRGAESGDLALRRGGPVVISRPACFGRTGGT